MNASDFAHKAAELMEDRGKERDQANGERSMARCVQAFNAMTGHQLTVEDGWLFMVYLKHARMRGGQYKQDDYEDAVAYEALMAEEAYDFQPEFAGIVDTRGLGDDYIVEDIDAASEERRRRLMNEVFNYYGTYTTLQDILDTEVKNRWEMY